MTDPSDYERDAWQKIKTFKGRPLTRLGKTAGEKIAAGAAHIEREATSFLNEHPRAQSAVSKGQKAAAKTAVAVSTGAKGFVEALPDGVVDWSGEAIQSVTQTVTRASRAGLSPKQVLKRHQKRGHKVTTFSDLRLLDLEEIDAVRGRNTNLVYPAIAAASGAAAGLIISGGEIVTAVSGGAAAAPSGAAIAGAFVGDATVVLGLASRSVGHIALLYGYDPEEQGEKLFVMSVVNAGTAVSASAKTAALADISRLTQALVRGKTWAILNESILSRVSNQFAKAFGFRLTKQGLGKFVPAAGIVIGSTFNWATLERIVDTADFAYRQRFLLEKYPQFAEDNAPVFFDVKDEEGSDESDEVISLIDEIAEAGGGDLSIDPGTNAPK